MPYNSKVLDHYENPRNVGSMSKDDPNVGTGLVGAPACGDVMKLQIKIEALLSEGAWLYVKVAKYVDFNGQTRFRVFDTALQF